ncbi:MAG: ATP-dependent RNA helicase HrpA, partial [bacterium]
MNDFNQSALDELAVSLQQCLISHRPEFSRLLGQIKRRVGDNKPADKLIKKLSDQIEQSCSIVAARKALIPEINYPDELPIADRRDEIADMIRNHQVVVVAGETGSGKTTQLPKICLDIGQGVYGMIGHTQPRRIAARSVANRIAEEIGDDLGERIGYQVRFTDHSSDKTLVKLMTDGILLGEIQSDPLLSRYDTLIIDEAHERSLNIDFLLGYIRQILPKRPDLKVIITSATIDVEKFSAHFSDAPIIEVSGRTYPVEIIYRAAPEDEDLSGQITSVVEEILALPDKGDILVFLSGEREIREVASAIRRGNFRHVDVLPLYARLSLAEQTRVFKPHSGIRVVLATNVAETSLTVPGIRYVIDPGFARISRYSYKNKVQRLPIEAISKASANQRAGRCGRVAEGICYRLYDEEDFLGRADFTDAEILRTNLAAVILKMLNLRLGDIRHFPFVDKPDNRLINDGFNLLQEIRAVDGGRKLNALGRTVAR